jgi:hypothetical protein
VASWFIHRWETESFIWPIASIIQKRARPDGNTSQLSRHGLLIAVNNRELKLVPKLMWVPCTFKSMNHQIMDKRLYLGKYHRETIFARK